jgi:hypothetical protein
VKVEYVPPVDPLLGIKLGPGITVETSLKGGVNLDVFERKYSGTVAISVSAGVTSEWVGKRSFKRDWAIKFAP